MTWKQFVKNWRPVNLTRLGIPARTVYEWHAGTKEPKGWQRDAATLFIETKAGAKIVEASGEAPSKPKATDDLNDGKNAPRKRRVD